MTWLSDAALDRLSRAARWPEFEGTRYVPVAELGRGGMGTVQSLWKGLLFGLAVGAGFAFLIAAMPDPSGKHYYWEIVLPGSLVGAIVGYATQRYGRPGAGRAAA